MGLITGYMTVKSRAEYFLGFKFEGQELMIKKILPEGIESPEIALHLAKILAENGMSPEIRRVIIYNGINGRLPRKDPEYEEPIVSSNF